MISQFNFPFNHRKSLSTIQSQVVIRLSRAILHENRNGDRLRPGIGGGREVRDRKSRKNQSIDQDPAHRVKNARKLDTGMRNESLTKKMMICMSRILGKMTI